MGRHHRPTSPGARARQKAYRQTDAGRLARKMYLMQPEVKMKMAMRRTIKRHIKGLA